MEPGLLIMLLPAIAGLGFAALIVFIISAVQESKHGAPTVDIVRRGYLYLVSFVTLLIASAALVALLDTGLRSFVFPQANDLPSYRQVPPSLYLPGENAAAPDKSGATITCTNGCTLTNEQKDAVTSWAASYRNWQQTTDVNYQRSRALVQAISFLVIAFIVFFFHWKLANRDHREHRTTAMRVTHFWLVSFIMLIASVLSAAFLLNTTLKTVFLKNDITSNAGYAEPPVSVSGRDAVESVATCGTACGLSADTVQLAKDWKTDYDASLAAQNQQATARANRQSDFAREIAFLIVALPLFAYHFKTVWRETRGSSEKVTNDTEKYVS